MIGDEAELRLIRQAVSGEASAFERLLLKYRHELLIYVDEHMPDDLRRTIDPQDILQDVCVDAFRRRTSFWAIDRPSAFKWLTRLARHRTIDLVRRQRAMKRGGIGTDGIGGHGSLVSLLRELAVYERTPSRSALAHEMIGTLQRSMQNLPEDYREAVRLRYIEGMQVIEIAGRMNRTDRAVHMLCNRGLKALRLELRSASMYV